MTLIERFEKYAWVGVLKKLIAGGLFTTDGNVNDAVNMFLAPNLGFTLIEPSSIVPASSTVKRGNTVEVKTRANAGSKLAYALLTINGVDDAGDGGRFAVPDETVHLLNLGETYEIPFDVDIARVSVVYVSNVENLTSGVIFQTSGSGNIETALNTFNFPAGVRNIRVFLSAGYTADTVVNAADADREYSMLSMVGSA